MPSILEQQLEAADAEVSRLNSIQQELIQRAQNEGRDMTDDEWKLFEAQTSSMQSVSARQKRLGEAVEVTTSARSRAGEIWEQIDTRRRVEPGAGAVEYRSAGQYVCDLWKGGAGDREARDRIEHYSRAVQHQTTADNLGIIPEVVVGPLVTLVDQSRPIVGALGVQPLPGGPTFYRPKVVTHTDVGPQSAEKAELPSRKMSITRVPATVQTYGGVVNVSRQDIDWSSPNIMDIVTSDLAGEYAVETELVTATALDTAAAAGPVLPTGAVTGAQVAAAIWTAVGQAYGADKTGARVIIAVSPDMLGLLGPVFAPVNPTNAYSTGFSPADFASGLMGSVGGVPVYMSNALAAGTMLVIKTSAVELYETRIGQLSVIEPSVLGVQVAYAGYFSVLILTAGAIVQITKTP